MKSEFNEGWQGDDMYQINTSTQIAQINIIQLDLLRVKIPYVIEEINQSNENSPELLEQICPKTASSSFEHISFELFSLFKIVFEFESSDETKALKPVSSSSLIMGVSRQNFFCFSWYRDEPVKKAL